MAELCRKYAVNPTVFYGWKEKFIEGGKQALTRSRRNEGGGDLQGCWASYRYENDEYSMPATVYSCEESITALSNLMSAQLLGETKWSYTADIATL
jgi:transposase-like protein